jgi:hypothetical protein
MCKFCVRQDLGGEFTRREVLATMAGAGMAAGLMGSTVLTAAAGAGGTPSPADPLDIRVVYLRPAGKYWLGWPGTFWDVDGFAAKSRRLVEQFGRELGVRPVFEPAPLHEKADIEAFVKKVQAEKPKGVLVFPLHADEFISGATDRIAQSGIPTIIFAGLGMWHNGFAAKVVPTARQKGVYLPSSGDFELGPVRFGMKMIQANYRLQRTKIAVLRGNETSEVRAAPLGLTLRFLPRRRFPDTLKTIGETPEVIAMAERRAKQAQKVVEPTRQDLINAAKNYFASLKIMEEEGCQGITMDCLGLVQDHKIPTPPCLAWAEMFEHGRSGTCEADLNAVMSHELCLKLLDRPGFQQDPVAESEHNTLIGAHCVCATKLNGLDQPPEPYILRSHSESDLGVSVQVLWRIGQEVTVMQIVAPDKMLLGKGKVLRNYDTPPAGGCRTSVELAVDGPADTRDTKGFHQLFIYGDHVRRLQAYAQMYGITTEHI